MENIELILKIELNKVWLTVYLDLLWKSFKLFSDIIITQVQRPIKPYFMYIQFNISK